jgi:hypothetical protein
MGRHFPGSRDVPIDPNNPMGGSSDSVSSHNGGGSQSHDAPTSENSERQAVGHSGDSTVGQQQQQYAQQQQQHAQQQPEHTHTQQQLPSQNSPSTSRPVISPRGTTGQTPPGERIYPNLNASASPKGQQGGPETGGLGGSKFENPSTSSDRNDSCPPDYAQQILGGATGTRQPLRTSEPEDNYNPGPDEMRVAAMYQDRISQNWRVAQQREMALGREIQRLRALQVDRDEVQGEAEQHPRDPFVRDVRAATGNEMRHMETLITQGENRRLVSVAGSREMTGGSRGRARPACRPGTPGTAGNDGHLWNPPSGRGPVPAKRTRARTEAPRGADHAAPDRQRASLSSDHSSRSGRTQTSFHSARSDLEHRSVSEVDEQRRDARRRDYVAGSQTCYSARTGVTHEMTRRLDLVLDLLQGRGSATQGELPCEVTGTTEPRTTPVVPRPRAGIDGSSSRSRQRARAPLEVVQPSYVNTTEMDHRISYQPFTGSVGPVGHVNLTNPGAVGAAASSTPVAGYLANIPPTVDVTGRDLRSFPTPGADPCPAGVPSWVFGEGAGGPPVVVPGALVKEDYDKLKALQTQIVPFAGKDVDDGGYFLTNFVTNCHRVGLSQQHWIYFLQGKLTGAAATWYRVLHTHSPNVSWAELCAAFLKEFGKGGMQYSHEAQRQLLSACMKPGEKLADFCQRMRDMARGLFISDDRIKFEVLRHLPVAARRALTEGDRGTINDLRRRLQVIDDLNEEEARERTHGGHPSQSSKPKETTQVQVQVMPAQQVPGAIKKGQNKGGSTGQNASATVPAAAPGIVQDLGPYNVRGIECRRLRVDGNQLTYCPVSDKGGFCIRCGWNAVDFRITPQHVCIPRQENLVCGACGMQGHHSNGCVKTRMNQGQVGATPADVAK